MDKCGHLTCLVQNLAGNVVFPIGVSCPGLSSNRGHFYTQRDSTFLPLWVTQSLGRCGWGQVRIMAHLDQDSFISHSVLDGDQDLLHPLSFCCVEIVKMVLDYN